MWSTQLHQTCQILFCLNDHETGDKYILASQTAQCTCFTMTCFSFVFCFVVFFSLRLLFTHLRAWNEDFCDADISKKLRVPSHGSYHRPFLWSVKSQMLREGPVIYWLMSWKFKIPSINFNFFMNLLILFKLFFHRFGVEVIMNWLVK